MINFTDTSLIAHWQPVTGATSYELFVATDTNFANPVTGYNPKSITDTVATITPLSPGTKYYYKVEAVNSRTKSAASNIIVLTTPLASADGYVLIGNSDYILYCLNATSGAIIWTAKTGSEVTGTPTVNNNLVYVGSNDKQLHVYDLGTGTQRWSFSTGGSVVSTPTIVK